MNKTKGSQQLNFKHVAKLLSVIKNRGIAGDLQRFDVQRAHESDVGTKHCLNQYWSSELHNAHSAF